MEEIFKQLYEELDSLYQGGDFDAAETYLIHKLRENGNSCFACYNPLEAAIINELGSLYRCQGRTDESIESFETLAEMLKIRVGTENEEYANVVNNLAGAYRLKGDYDKAIRNFETARDIYEKGIGKNSYLYSSLLNNMGLVYMELNQCREAEKNFHEALRIIEKLEENSEEFTGDKAVTYSNLASVCLKEKNLDKAEEYLSCALDIYGTVLPEYRYHMGAVYNTLGHVRRIRKNYEGARKAYLWAMEWTEKFYGKNNEYEKVQANLAQIEQDKLAMIDDIIRREFQMFQRVENQ